MSKYNDENIFCIYGFETNGLTDPDAIVQQSIEKNSIFKCPVIAEDPATAIELFSKKHPHLMVAGIVSLSELKKDLQLMESFRDDN